MSLSNIHVRRYGDPSARRFGPTRPVVVVVGVGLIVLAVFAGIDLLVHSIQAHDAVHVLGSEIGIAFAVLLVVAGAVGWRIYWHALARSLRVTRERHPESLVVGARLPDLGDEVLRKSWPPEWGLPSGPQRVVLVVDSSGVLLLNTAVPIARIVQLTWDQVKGFTPVEYVESKVAYEGLAIDGLPEGSAIVVQLNTPSQLVRFPRGKALMEVAERAEERRPPHRAK
ncbi:MAG: hypothetical protein ABIS08_04190 [Pseudolysinimonas sp.]